MEDQKPAIPVVDLSLPIAERAKILMEGFSFFLFSVSLSFLLTPCSACKETGFFYVINHSLPDEKVSKVFGQSKLFFEQETR